MSFKDRLKKARLAANLTQTELAKLAGVSQTTVYKIEKGDHAGTKHILAMAKAVNADPVWLLTGKGNSQMLTVKPAISYEFLPLLTAAQVIDCLVFKNCEFNMERQIVVVTNKISVNKNIFAYEIEGDALIDESNPQRSLYTGDTALIDSGRKPKAGDLVMFCVGDKDVKIRKYTIEGEDENLFPLNKSYPVIKKDETMRLLGTVIGKQTTDFYI